MEENEKYSKIPGTILSTFLFLFFYLTIMTVCRDISSMYNDMIESAIAEDNPLWITIFLALSDMVFLCLSFWSIIRILKAKPDGITCMRWALSIMFVTALYHFFRDLGQAITVNWLYIANSTLYLILAVSFLLYLAKSKVIKQMYPKSERRYSIGGWIWTSFLFVFLVGIGYYFYIDAMKIYLSKKIDIKTMNLPDGSICDGNILFK